MQSNPVVSLADRLAAIRLDGRMDVAGGRPGYLAVAGNGTHVRLSPEAFQLLDALRGGVRLEDLAGALNARSGRRPVTVEELSNIVCRAVEDLERAGSGVPTAPAGFWATRPLLSASAVMLGADFLTWLFTRRAACVVAAIVAVVLATAPAGWFSFAVSGGTLATAYGLLLLSLVVHEFGHAAACRRFGLMPGAVGFTMYLVFPALYTDVTATWRLARRQRVVVDLGGNYVQMLVGAGYLALFGFTGMPLFGAAATLVALSMLFSLNPVFKCDGYWVVADALGVTNLSGQPRILARAFIRRLREGAAMALPWPTPVVAALVVYAGLTVGIWLWFMTPLLPMLTVRFTSLDVQIGAIADAVGNGGVGLWSACLGLAVSLFLFAASVVMVVRLGQSLAPESLLSRLRSLAHGRRRGGTGRRAG